MESIAIFSKQYALVQSSRQALFEYCKTIKPEDFTNQNTSFGRGGSMRNLLVHIANTYEYWILKVANQQNVTFSTYEAHQNIESVIQLFQNVDAFMTDFIQSMREPEIEMPFEIDGKKNSASLLQLFTHVITHEFHHKGQILSISRHLGYIPVDTDVIR